MIFVWGTRRSEKHLGYVADFCPICRSLQPFALTKVSSSSHIYFVSLGKGQTLGHLLLCQSCRTRFPADIADYLAPVKQVRNLENLIEASHPRARERHAERLALEKEIQGGTGAVSGELRERLLLEPFQILAPEVEARFGSDTRFDRRSGLGCLGTLLVPLVLLILGLVFKGTEAFPDWLVGTLLGLFGLGAVVTLVLLFLGPRHHLNTVILPRLAGALRPLGPNRHELKTCLDRMAAVDYRIGKKLRLQNLWAAVAGDPPAPHRLR